MQLAERGVLDLDAPIQKYLPSFPIKPWPISTRELLAHLAGIRHYASPAEIDSTRHYLNLAEPLTIFARDPLIAEPGTAFNYTTYGYVVAGAVLEAVAGKRFTDVLSERVFKPAGIEHMQADDSFAIIPNRARGYKRGPDGRIENCTPADTSNKIPGGGLCSTAEDLVRFALAVNSGKLLKPETVKLMFQPQHLRSGQQTNYGLGWSIVQDGASRLVGHSGGQQGVSTMLLMDTNRGYVVAVMANLEAARVDDSRRVSCAFWHVETMPMPTANRKWPLGINTYCLRFQRWNDRQLLEYCVAQKLDAIFLQDSLDPDVMEPKHWAEVRAWSKDAGLHFETGGGAILPKTPDAANEIIALLGKNIDRARAMGSPIVRALLASDRYVLPPGSLEAHIETAAGILRAVRSRAIDAGVKIAIENHKDLQAWETRRLIETAGTDFVGSYLDTGNPVFVAEDPLTTIEELGPVAVTFHLRDSVVYDDAGGVAVQWVPLGEGTVDFKQVLAKAGEILPDVYVYCKPITARPPVVLPVYSEEFWNKWFPRARARDLGRFLALARRGRPYDKAHITADVAELRERYMPALKVQQLEHMQQSLAYCRNTLELGLSRL